MNDPKLDTEASNAFDELVGRLKEAGVTEGHLKTILGNPKLLHLLVCLCYGMSPSELASSTELGAIAPYADFAVFQRMLGHRDALGKAARFYQSMYEIDELLREVSDSWVRSAFVLYYGLGPYGTIKDIGELAKMLGRPPKKLQALLVTNASIRQRVLIAAHSRLEFAHFRKIADLLGRPAVSLLERAGICNLYDLCCHTKAEIYTIFAAEDADRLMVIIERELRLIRRSLKQ